MKRSFLLLCAVLLVLGCAAAVCRLPSCLHAALAQSAAPSAAEAASAASEESSAAGSSLPC